MINFISNLIGNDHIATVIMSFIPLIELKGAIVFAWDKLGFLISFLLAYAGSTLVFFPIFFLLCPILELLKKIKWFNRFALKVQSYFENKANETLQNQLQNNKTGKSTQSLKKLGVFVFVAIPLPMTGVWTGTAIAVFLGLKFKEAVLPVVTGNFIAGLLVCAISALCKLIGINLDIVLWVLFALAVIILVITVIKLSRQKTERKG